MGKILLVRHAESVANAGGISRPNKDIALTPHGVEQAIALVDALPWQPGKVFVSEFHRAQATAEPSCRHWGLPAEEHMLLNEFSMLDFSLIAGLNLQQRKPLSEKYWQECDPDLRMGEDAETFREFSDRVEAFREKVRSMSDDIVVFGHGIWIALFIWRTWNAGPIDRNAMQAFRNFERSIQMKNCAVYSVVGQVVEAISEEQMHRNRQLQRILCGIESTSKNSSLAVIQDEYWKAAPTLMSEFVAEFRPHN